MGLNTYPSNPFPPSTDRMDVDALETEVSKLNNDVSELKSGLTNLDNEVNGVSGAIGQVQEQVNGITPTLRYTSATTGTHADKLATLQTAFDALTDKQKQRAYILYGAAKYSVGNCGGGIFYNIYYDFPRHETRIIMIDLNNVYTKMARLTITSSSTALESLESSEGQNAFMLYA